MDSSSSLVTIVQAIMDVGEATRLGNSWILYKDGDRLPVGGVFGWKGARVPKQMAQGSGKKSFSRPQIYHYAR